MRITGLDQAVTQFDGTPFTDGGNQLTFRSVIVRALSSAYTDEKVDGAEQYHRGDLGRRIFRAKSIDLSAEDVALIKRLVGRAFTPPVVVQAWDLLEGKQQETEPFDQSKCGGEGVSHGTVSDSERDDFDR